MIEHLEITNYALIENLSVDFSEGFNVITGETGSGKSIILGALGLLMGEKAETSAIRTGTDTMIINAVVSIPENHEILQYLQEHGIEPEDGKIIIRRTVKLNGRGTISIQGQLVTRQELTEIADSLIDMHGQSEHQSLLISDKQRKILDSYSSSEELLCLCSEDCHEIFETKKQIDELNRQIEESIRQEDYLKYSLSEIENASVKIGEDKELSEKVSVLSHFETIVENLTECNEMLKQARNNLKDGLLNCRKAAKCDQTLEDFASRIESSSIEAEDISESLRDYLSSVDYSEDSINSMQERLALLQRLKRKYGPELSDVLKFAKQAKESLEIADNKDQVLKEYSKKLDKLVDRYKKNASLLTEKRVNSAKTLQKSIKETLRTLGMPNAEFEIKVESVSDKISATGSDVIVFLISANPGEPLKPISAIASGGELSRVMLALKTVLAKSDAIETQVFDEVDTGIGGTVARSLALCISDLSKEKQVIAITHLASLASAAKTQFVVSKNVENGRTYTHLKEVRGDDRISEIARMLSGDTSQVSLEHAKKLILG